MCAVGRCVEIGICGASVVEPGGHTTFYVDVFIHLSEVNHMATFIFAGGFGLEAATPVGIDGVVLTAIDRQCVFASSAGALTDAFLAGVVCCAGIIVITGQRVGCVNTTCIRIARAIRAGVEVIAILFSGGHTFVGEVTLVSIGTGISIRAKCSFGHPLLRASFSCHA